MSISKQRSLTGQPYKWNVAMAYKYTANTNKNGE